MKTAIAISVTLALTASALAQADVEGPDCDGYVVHFGNDITLVPEGNDVCSPKWVTSMNSKFARRILRTCPFGTHCHVEGGYSNHGIEEVTRVERSSPWPPPLRPPIQPPK